jgi:predicted RNase H-like HicB family nuclease
MTQYFPIIVEQESNGAFSAWVAGLPGVYAAADSAAAAKRGIRGALAAHLKTLGTLGRTPHVKADLTVLRHDVSARRTSLRYVSVGALMGARRSRAKAKASQLNGRLGGRPRMTASAQTKKKHEKPATG